MTDEPKKPAEVHTLHATSLADIPGQLRQMADMIEQGKHTGNSAVFILLHEDAEPEDWPQIFGWGEALGDYQMVGVLEMAKTFFVVNKTKRFT